MVIPESMITTWWELGGHNSSGYQHNSSGYQPCHDPVDLAKKVKPCLRNEEQKQELEKNTALKSWWQTADERLSTRVGVSQTDEQRLFEDRLTQAKPKP
jgi:hypothetical protein